MNAIDLMLLAKEKKKQYVFQNHSITITTETKQINGVPNYT